MATPLIGIEHRRILASLKTLVGSGPPARIVLLEGVSGSGKSRLIRELYSWLRTERSDKFWPPLESQTDGLVGFEPLQDRKALGPSLNALGWAGKSGLPTFGWWELTGGRSSRDQSALNMIDEVEPRFRSLVVPIMFAAYPNKVRPHLKDLGLKLLEDVIDQGRGNAIEWIGTTAAEALLGTAIPGFSLMVSLGKSGFAVYLEQRTANRLADNGIADLGDRARDESREAAVALAEAVRACATPDVPGVVVVEDVQFMNESTRVFFDEVVKGGPKHPVTLILTAWPEGEVEADSVFTRWRADMVAAQAVEAMEVSPPTPNEIAEGVVLHYAPDTDPAVATEAAARFGNVLAIELLLTQARVAREIGLTRKLSREQLARAPRDLEDLYRARFAEISQQIQAALAVAAGSLPQGRGSVENWPFIRNHVADAIAESEDVDLRSVNDLYEIVVTLRGGGRTEDEQIWLTANGLTESFREVLMADAAADYLEVRLGASDEVQEAIVAHLAQWCAEHGADELELPNTLEARIAATWLLELVAREQDARASVAPMVLLGAAWRRAQDLEEIGDRATASAVLKSALADLSELPLAENYALARHVELIGELEGDAAKEEEIRRFLASVDAGRIAEIDWRFELGLLLEDLQRPDDAIKEFTAAFAAIDGLEARHGERVSQDGGGGNPVGAWLMPTEIRQHLVSLLGEVGRYTDQIDVIAADLNAHRADPDFGPEDRYTRMLYDWLREAIAKAGLDRAPEDYFTVPDEEFASVLSEQKASDRRAAEARALFDAKDYPSAIAALREVIADPLAMWHHRDATRRLVSAYEATSAFQELIDFVDDQSSKFDSMRIGWHESRRCAALVELGRADEAIKSAQRAWERALAGPGATGGDIVPLMHRLDLAHGYLAAESPELAQDVATGMIVDILQALANMPARLAPAAFPSEQDMYDAQFFMPYLAHSDHLRDASRQWWPAYRLALLDLAVDVVSGRGEPTIDIVPGSAPLALAEVAEFTVAATETLDAATVDSESDRGPLAASPDANARHPLARRAMTGLIEGSPLLAPTVGDADPTG